MQPQSIRYPLSSAQRSAAWSWSNDLRPRAWTVVRVALGLLLVTAAALKLSGLNVTAIPRAGWFATPQVQVIVAVWELILGVWLISRAWRFGAWLAALLTFITFAVVSIYLAWTGVQSCACFGAIHTSPWTVFTIDVAAIALLFVSWPPGQTMSRKPWVHAFVPLGVLAGLGVMAGFAAFPGGFSNVIDFGLLSPGGRAEQELWVENPMDSAVEVVSVRTSCPCLSLRIDKHVFAVRERVRATMILDLRTEPDFVGELSLQAIGVTKDGTVVFTVHGSARVDSGDW